MVTGCLTGKDNLRRKFAQSFFLAPQDNGYFVLNDVFRYVEDHEPSELPPVTGDGDAAAVTVTPETGKIIIQNFFIFSFKIYSGVGFMLFSFFTEPSHFANSSAPDPTNSHVNKGQTVAENAYEPSNHHERHIPIENVDNVEPHFQSNGNDDSQATELASSAQEKKSYASIVKVQKEGLVATKVYVQTNTLKSGPNKTENKVVESVESTEVSEAALDSVNNPESSDAHEEVEGHSIYIRNLPLNVTAAQLELEFKKFGPIKPGGIQVRNNKVIIRSTMHSNYPFAFYSVLMKFCLKNETHTTPKTRATTNNNHLWVKEAIYMVTIRT
ncbi:putative G3BP-like protein [Glycine max]|nr:putative G3BP-like protein [Glycine max]